MSLFTQRLLKKKNTKCFPKKAHRFAICAVESKMKATLYKILAELPKPKQTYSADEQVLP